MKKIVRIMDRLNIGGPSIHVMILSQLDNTKFSSTLVVGNICDGEGDMSYLAAEYNVTPLYVEELGREIKATKDIIALWKIYKILRQEKPHIVHTHKSKAGLIGRISALLAGVPIIIHTFHGHVFHGYFSPRKTRFFLFLERLIARFTTKIIVISKEQKQEICYKYRIAHSQKFTIIPLGFKFAPFHTIGQHQNWLRRSYNIKANDIIIGIVGRLAKIKNHEMFFHVAANICKKHSNVKFAVIGDGEEKDNLVCLQQKLNLQNHILFTGWIQEPGKIYSDLDIIALTSINEGTPVVLIEGMYYQKPVVATNVGGVSDVVNGKSGFISPSQDIESFTHNILKLIESKKLRQEMGQHAHNQVKEKYSHLRLISDIENLYDYLLKNV